MGDAVLRHIGVCLIVLALAACDLEKLAAKDDVDFAKHYISLFQARDFDAIEAGLDPKLKDGALRTNLESIADYFPAEAPTKIELILFNSKSSLTGGPVTQSFRFLYHFPKQPIYMEIVFEKRGESRVVMGVHVLPPPQGQTGLLSLSDLTPVKILFLTLAIANPLFILVVLGLCITTKTLKRKWLWAIFILIGFIGVTLDWSSGEITIQPLSFMVFGAAMNGGEGASLSLSVPLGAILFLVHRRRWRRQAVQDTVQPF